MRDTESTTNESKQDSKNYLHATILKINMRLKLQIDSLTYITWNFFLHSEIIKPFQRHKSKFIFQLNFLFNSCRQLFSKQSKGFIKKIAI